MLLHALNRLACPLDQPLRQPQLCAQKPLAARHFAVVGLVIVTGQMQQPMQNQHLDLDSQRMLLLLGLAQRGGHAHGQIAGNLFRANALSWKRKHIGGLVLAAKLAIQAAYRSIGGQLHIDLATQAHSRLRQQKKAAQCARRGNLFILVRWRSRLR
jgi:hypothetical protein